MAKKALPPSRDQYQITKSEQQSTEVSNDGYKQHRPGQQDCTTSRVWMILTVLFMLTTVALGGYVMYIKILEQKETMSFEEAVIRKYPGYFRTPEEQAVFEEQYNQVAVQTNYSEEINGTAQSNCTFSCQIYRGKRSERQAYVHKPLAEIVKLYSIIHEISKRAVTQDDGNKIYHSCCISTIKFISPDTANDSYGNPVTILKLKTRSQYFQTELCQHAEGCTGCKCGQRSTLTNALVKSSESGGISSVSIKLIKLPGCCKCINGLVP